MEGIRLKSAQFRKERENAWKELDRLLEKIEDGGMKRLTSQELHRLPILYRTSVSSLSVARAISLDRALLDYLEALVRRAYIHMYTSKQPARIVISKFFRSLFPGGVYAYRYYMLAALGLLLLGMGTGYVLTLNDPERYYSFVSKEMAGGRTPASSREELRSVLYSGGEQSSDSLTLFSSFLFTNNAKVGILCFCLGFVAGIPVVLLLYYNGMVLGAMGAVYANKGLGPEFWAWVMGHGVTELGAVCVCGGAGLVLGMALVFPGSYSRITNLGMHGRRVAPVVIGAIGMFFIAAIIEGFLRQRIHTEIFRWGIAATTLVLWLLYFVLLGRRAPEPAEEAG